MKKLLLHICCAPDASVGFERLTSNWEVKGFFLNPNIHPPNEYFIRLKALETLAQEMGFTYEEGPYEPEVWFESIRGFGIKLTGGKE